MSLARNTASLAALALVAGALVATGGATAAYAADAVAGGQSAGDSLFPNQGNSGYDALHYDINFRVDVTVGSTHNAASITNLPNAAATITAKTTGAPLSSYSFDFQGTTSTLAASTLNVDSVTVNGAPASFTRIENTTVSNAVTDNHKLIITPSTPVDGEFVTVVNYSGRPVIHTDTDNSLEGWNNTVDGASFVNQPIGSMTLFPNNNTPRDKATYKFTIEAPTTLRTSNFAQSGGKAYPAGVVSNGELTSRTANGDGSRTTWVWEQKKQMASELSLVSVGRFDIYTSDITLASGRTIPEWTFIDPSATAAQQASTLGTRAQLKAMIDFYETKYGPYPGNSTGLVTDNTTGINYALETQDRPFSPNSASRGTTYHEIAHQWWGDNVSPTDWNDITLNEGPATYTEYQLPNEAIGTTANTTTEQSLYSFWNSTATSSSTWAVPPAAMTTASQLFGSPTYNKGGMALEALRTSIGAADYETLMRQYQLQYGGGQIPGRRTAAFEVLAEQISGRDLTAFFQTWFYTSGKPAWPVKFNLNVAGPTTQLNAGDSATYTVTTRNTGKVAMPTGTVVTVDLANVLDDATIGTLPANTTLDGTTLTWNVPATALAATSSIAIPVTLGSASAGGTLKAEARASTLGSTCLECASSIVVGTAPISPAPAPTINGGIPAVGAPLTADTTGWADGTSFSYQWLIDGTPVAGANAATFTPTADVLGLAVTVRVTGTKSGFNATTQTSAATAVGVRSAPVSGTPTITGTPKLGSALVLDPGTWSPGEFFTYQWRANGTSISGATGPLYIPTLASQVGQTIDVVVTGSKAGYTTTAKTSAATVAVAAGDPQVATPTPVLSGTPKVGAAFQPSVGEWDSGTTLTFQWAANGTNVSGAAGTGATITPTAAQLGQTFVLTVTGTKAGTSVVRSSAPSAVVEPGTQVLQPTPTITGTPRAETAVSGVQGTWDTGTTKTNKWYADGVEIAGATGTSYTPTIAQIGQVLTYEVTSTRAGYTTVTKASGGKTIVGLAQTLTPTPTITGDATVGDTLTVVPGDWDADASLTQQWLADGEAIVGASGVDYELTAADLGKVIAVAVTSTKPNYETVTKTSDATSAVAAGDLTLTPTPTISGTPKVNVELTAVPGTWDEGVTLSYQWFADDEEIEGATESTYTVGSSKVGATITVAVTGTKTGYTSTTKTSDPTAEVALGDLAATPVPTITGTPKVDVTLTAESGTWTEGTELSYQWFADGEEIDGATGTTFTPTTDLAGSTITVAVTGTKSGYNEVTKTSLATAEVAKGDFVLAPVPTITGTAKVDVALTAVAGDWDAGTELAYQWYVGEDAVEGATGVTFTPTAADAGSVVTVAVTGTKANFESITKTSEPTDAVADGDLVAVPTPVIRGTVRVGNTVSAFTGTWDAGTTLAYQWKRSGVAISGATAATYKARSADHGRTLTVVVTGSKPGYVTESKTSAGVMAEGGVQSLQPTPVITGSAKVGSTLKVKAATYDTGVTRTYAWYANGVKFGYSTNSVKLTSSKAGKRITVRVTASKAGYFTVTKASAPTATVK